MINAQAVVEIDTFWNVKFLIMETTSISEQCRNRYILECKGCGLRSSHSSDIA